MVSPRSGGKIIQIARVLLVTAWSEENIVERSKNIAERFNIKRGSVTGMLKKLAKKSKFLTGK